MNWSLKNIPIWLRWVGSIAGTLLLALIGEKIYDDYIKEDESVAKLVESIQQSIEESKRLELCVIPDSELSNQEIQRMRKLQMHIQYYIGLVEKQISMRIDKDSSALSIGEEYEYLQGAIVRFKVISKTSADIVSQFVCVVEDLCSKYSQDYLESIMIASGFTRATIGQMKKLSDEQLNMVKEVNKMLYLDVKQFLKTRDDKYRKNAIDKCMASNEKELELTKKMQDCFLLLYNCLNTLQSEIVFANND